jgi:sarcosine oxidase subunit delta
MRVGHGSRPHHKKSKVFCFFSSEKKSLPSFLPGLQMRLTCPFCGPRGIEEFSYFGDANLQRPTADATPDEWVTYVYLRENPAGLHSELWYHTAACRQFLKVERDTSNHTILSTEIV